MLVWNEIQKTEATDLHGVSAERVIVAGAPRFDECFAMRPSSTREAFCTRIGLDPTAPFLLYLCSSEFVAPREVEFVTRWISHLRESSDPEVRTSGVLVRPHPAHLKQWKSADLSRFPNAALWNEKETMNADQSLYDSAAMIIARGALDRFGLATRQLNRDAAKTRFDMIHHRWRMLMESPWRATM